MKSNQIKAQSVNIFLNTMKSKTDVVKNHESNDSVDDDDEVQLGIVDNIFIVAVTVIIGIGIVTVLNIFNTVQSNHIVRLLFL